MTEKCNRVVLKVNCFFLAEKHCFSAKKKQLTFRTTLLHFSVIVYKEAGWADGGTPFDVEIIQRM